MNFYDFFKEIIPSQELYKKIYFCLKLIKINYIFYPFT